MLERRRSNAPFAIEQCEGDLACEALQTEVAKKTGIAESTISDVLASKRELNRSQIGKLARYFHIETRAFSFRA